MDLNEKAPSSKGHISKEGATCTLPSLLSVEEAAQRLGVGLSLMRTLVSSGDVESIKIGRLRRVPEDALGAYVQRLREHASRRTQE